MCELIAHCVPGPLVVAALVSESPATRLFHERSRHSREAGLASARWFLPIFTIHVPRVFTPCLECPRTEPYVPIGRVTFHPLFPVIYRSDCNLHLHCYRIKYVYMGAAGYCLV